MLLGTKVHDAGNTIRYVVDYSDWLNDGETLKAPCTVVLAPASAVLVTDITITGVVFTASQEIVFLMSGGSANETFTLNVVATNSRNETKNDTLAFSVTAP